MGTNERLLARCDSLLDEARELEHKTIPESSHILEIEPYGKWISGGRVFLEQVFGEKHTFTATFTKATPLGSHTVHSVEGGRGILSAARDAVADGWLGTIERRVAADVFVSFLDMADHLLEQGYTHAAASLGGAVLEDGLRRIAAKHDVTFKESHDLSALNQLLVQKQVYTAATRGQVQAWNTVRNSADHGKFTEYEPQHVKDMLSGIRTLLASYL